MYLVPLCCVFILGLCTASSTGNLTTVGIAPLRILCPVESLPGVERAISNHIQNSLLASGRAQAGLTLPPFKALFKSIDYQQFIMALFTRMASLGPKMYQGRPTFVCIRTEEDASHYHFALPDLWERCAERFPLSYQPIEPIASYQTNTLFLCRPFFSLRDDTPGPSPFQCPSVQENIFTDVPTRAKFATRATYITTFAINAYSQLPETQRAMSYTELLNAALAWGVHSAASQPWTYLLFERLIKNQCVDIPDIDAPPWHYPDVLSLNATSNITNKATDTNTIPQNKSQLSSSPGSLLQGLPANLVDPS